MSAAPMMATGQGNTAWKIIVSTAVSFALATTGILLRFVSRWLVSKRLEANDYLILAAYPFKLGIDVSSVLLVTYGIGQPITAINPANIPMYLKILYAGPLFYVGAIALTKLSILFLYYAAFPQKYMRYSVWTLSAVVVAWAIACIFVAFFACNPIHKAWMPEVPGTCINAKEYYLGAQIPNVITDFALLLLPLKAVLDLQLPLRQTLQMSAVLLLAGVTIAFDIVRLVVLVKLDNTAVDFTQTQVGLSIWTDLEPSVAMLVACLPIMRPLLHPRRALKDRYERSNSDLGDDNFDDPSEPYKGEYDHDPTVEMASSEDILSR